MEVIGIICEYNPFHNGHIYHINKIKEKYPNSLIILVLNGYFLERGEISLLSKCDKTNIAINHGVDLVIELPILFGTQSADTFAKVAVTYLNRFKVNRIIFGSESNDIEIMKDIVDKMDDSKYNEEVKNILDTGTNYPTALAKALKTSFDFKPNDLLGISYIKAINSINKKIIPETIQRTNDYHDLESNNEIISASNVRNKINNNEDIKKYVPKDVLDKLNTIDYDLYFNLLKAIIIRDDNLNEILDVDEGIENRLKEVITSCDSYGKLISCIKTRRYTYNKINRMLIHILLGIKKKHAKIDYDYIKVIGFNENGKKYLNKIKKDLDIPLLANKKSIIYDYEIKGSILYDMLTHKEDNQKKELSNKPFIF